MLATKEEGLQQQIDGIATTCTMPIVKHLTSESGYKYYGRFQAMRGMVDCDVCILFPSREPCTWVKYDAEGGKTPCDTCDNEQVRQKKRYVHSA